MSPHHSSRSTLGVIDYILRRVSHKEHQQQVPELERALPTLIFATCPDLSVSGPTSYHKLKSGNGICSIVVLECNSDLNTMPREVPVIMSWDG
jgi:hypothetical protein